LSPQRRPPLIQNLSRLELAYCIAVLLFTFALRGSLGFGGAVGLPLLALVLPVKILAPAWSLVGIVSSAAIIGRDRRHVAKREYLALLPGCALGVAAGLFLFKTLDAVLLARSLGAFIILYAIYSLWMTTRPPGSAPPVPPAVLRPLASFFSGAVGTLFGAMASIFFAMVLDAGGANKQAWRHHHAHDPERRPRDRLRRGRRAHPRLLHPLRRRASRHGPRPPCRRPHLLRAWPGRVSARGLCSAFSVRRSAATQVSPALAPDHGAVSRGSAAANGGFALTASFHSKLKSHF
jgi:hypothetical protein